MASVAAPPTSPATMAIGSSVSSHDRSANTSGRSTTRGASRRGHDERGLAVDGQHEHREPLERHGLVPGEVRQVGAHGQEHRVDAQLGHAGSNPVSALTEHGADVTDRAATGPSQACSASTIDPRSRRPRRSVGPRRGSTSRCRGEPTDRGAARRSPPPCPGAGTARRAPRPGSGTATRPTRPGAPRRLARRSSVTRTSCTRAWNRGGSGRSRGISRTRSRRCRSASSLKCVSFEAPSTWEKPVSPMVSAWRAAIRSTAREPPPTSSGTGWVGAGAAVSSVRWRFGPVVVTVSPSSSRRRATTASSRRSTRSAGGGSGWPMAACSSSACPAPMPSVKPARRDLADHERLVGQHRGVPQLVVQHHRGEGHPLGRGRGRGQRDHRRQGAGLQVVGDADLVDPDRLEPPAPRQPGGGVGPDGRHADAGSHGRDPSATARLPIADRGRGGRRCSRRSGRPSTGAARRRPLRSAHCWRVGRSSR